MKTFVDIFQQRGSAYDRAMRRFPHARDMEFAQLVQAARLQPGDVVADVPAGGNYLQHHLPPSCQWVGWEPCSSFSHHGAASERLGAPLLPLPWPADFVDVAISLAGVHHLEDKKPFFAECHRVVKPGGRLVVSDVLENSPVAHFLDIFVGANNSTGHEGAYLNGHSADELRETGWAIERTQVNDFYWQFSGLRNMAAFCHGLFDLRLCSLAATAAAIEKHLGVKRFPDGTRGMAWQLMTITAHKPLRQREVAPVMAYP